MRGQLRRHLLPLQACMPVPASHGNMGMMGALCRRRSPMANLADGDANTFAEVDNAWLPTMQLALDVPLAGVEGALVVSIQVRTLQPAYAMQCGAAGRGCGWCQRCLCVQPGSCGGALGAGCTLHCGETWVMHACVASSSRAYGPHAYMHACVCRHAWTACST